MVPSGLVLLFTPICDPIPWLWPGPDGSLVMKRMMQNFWLVTKRLCFPSCSLCLAVILTLSEETLLSCYGLPCGEFDMTRKPCLCPVASKDLRPNNSNVNEPGSGPSEAHNSHMSERGSSSSSRGPLNDCSMATTLITTYQRRWARNSQLNQIPDAQKLWDNKILLVEADQL